MALVDHEEHRLRAIKQAIFYVVAASAVVAFAVWLIVFSRPANVTTQVQPHSPHIITGHR